MFVNPIRTDRDAPRTEPECADAFRAAVRGLFQFTAYRHALNGEDATASLRRAEALLTRLETFGSPGTYTHVRAALIQSLRESSLRGYDFRRNAELLNLPERAAWILGEFFIAAPALHQGDPTGTAHRHNATTGRTAFGENRHSTLNAWCILEDGRTDAIGRGVVSSGLRALSAAFSEALPDFRRYIEARNLDELEAIMHRFRSGVRSVTETFEYENWGMKAFLRGASILRSLERETHRYLGHIVRIRYEGWPAEPGVRDDFTVRAAWVAGEWANLIQNCFDSIHDVITHEKHPGPAHRARPRVIREFRGPSLLPSDSMLDTLERIQERLLIDWDRPEPQEGLGRVIPKDEMLRRLAYPGCSLLVQGGDTPFGMYLLLGDRRAFPQEAVLAINALAKAGENLEGQWRWGMVVCVDGVERARARTEGMNCYDLISEAMRESSCGAEASRIYAVTRRGVFENTSWHKHESRGWESTGVMIEYDLPQRGRIPLEVIRLDLRPSLGFKMRHLMPKPEVRLFS